MFTRLHYWVYMFTLQCILVVVTKVYMFLRSFAGVLVAVIGASNYGASNYECVNELTANLQKSR